MRTSYYDRVLISPGPITASLDIVSENGTVEGWAFYRDSLAVCHVQICLGGVVLGEDMADKFRPDLLRAGLRYGYCAFYISIPITRSGKYQLALVDGRTGASITHGGPPEIFVPAFVAQPNIKHVAWADEEVLANAGCLQLEMNFERMGAERFVDALFRFVFGRWADSAALEGYCGALRSKTLSPDALLKTLLASDERQHQDRRLPSPFAKDFPFQYELLYKI